MKDTKFTTAIIIIFIILGFAINGFLSVFFSSNDEEIQRAFMDGKLSARIEAEKNPISLLTEKKECEEKGGVMTITGRVREESSSYELTCTSPSRVISEIKI